MYPIVTYVAPRTVRTTSAKESRIAKSRKQERTMTIETKINPKEGENPSITFTSCSRSKEEEADEERSRTRSKTKTRENDKLKFEEEEHRASEKEVKTMMHAPKKNSVCAENNMRAMDKETPRETP